MYWIRQRCLPASETLTSPVVLLPACLQSLSDDSRLNLTPLPEWVGEERGEHMLNLHDQGLASGSITKCFRGIQCGWRNPKPKLFFRLTITSLAWDVWDYPKPMATYNQSISAPSFGPHLYGNILGECSPVGAESGLDAPENIKTLLSLLRLLGRNKVANLRYYFPKNSI